MPACRTRPCRTAARPHSSLPACLHLVLLSSSRRSTAGTKRNGRQRVLMARRRAGNRVTRNAEAEASNAAQSISGHQGHLATIPRYFSPSQRACRPLCREAHATAALHQAFFLSRVGLTECALGFLAFRIWCKGVQNLERSTSICTMIFCVPSIICHHSTEILDCSRLFAAVCAAATCGYFRPCREAAQCPPLTGQTLATASRMI